MDTFFRPLPMSNPERLFEVSESGTITGGVTVADYDAWLHADVGIDGLAEWDVSSRAGDQIDLGDRWQHVLVYEASDRFSDVMGFSLLRGRPFRTDEQLATSPIPCWVSYQFWRQALGASEDVLGRRLRTGGFLDAEVEVVGVLPPLISSFDLNNPPPDIVVPGLRIIPNLTRQPIARIKAGVNPRDVQSRMQLVADTTSAPLGMAAHRNVRLRPLRDQLVRGGRPTAVLLITLSLLILVLVFLNVSHLLLARVASRASEFALRLALGASRWRIVRLLFIENLMLAILGAAFGELMGWGLASLIQVHVPVFPTGGRNMSLVPMNFGARAIAMTLMLALVMSLLGAVVSSWRLIRRDALALSRTPGAARTTFRAKTASALVICEVAVASIVLLGAVTVGLSAWKFLNQDLGYTGTGRYSISVGIRWAPNPLPMLVRRSQRRSCLDCGMLRV